MKKNKKEVKKISIINKIKKDIEKNKIKDLQDFYEKEIQILEFFKKPVNAMIHRFLINKMLYKIYEKGSQHPKDLDDCFYEQDYKHKDDIRYIRDAYCHFARAFNLVKKDDQKRIKLTKLGKKYVESDKRRPKDISESQAKVIINWIINNPFKSKVVIGINNLVELLFELMKNDVPIPKSDLVKHFILKSGKINEWKKEETRITQFNNYLCLCKELHLIETYKRIYYITPLGLKYIKHLYSNKFREIFKKELLI